MENNILCGFKGCPAYGSGCTVDQISWCPDYKINEEMVNQGEIKKNGKCLFCGWRKNHGPNCFWRDVQQL